MRYDAKVSYDFLKADFFAFLSDIMNYVSFEMGSNLT